jgi:hypothetical protein
MKIKLLLILLFAGCSGELLSNPIVPIMTDTVKSKGETNYAIKKFNNFLLINSFGINYYFSKK